MKIKQTIPFFLTLFGVALEYVAYWCVYSLGTCYGSFIHQSFGVIKPLYLFSLVTLPLAVLLVFVSSSIFKSWLKFAVWWIPLSVLIIAFASSTRGGSGIEILSFTTEDAVFMMSSLFVMLSVGIIVGKLLTVFLDKYFISSHAILRAWLKFIYFWLPFSFAFFVMPPLAHEFLDGYLFKLIWFPISLEYRAWFAGVLFVVISLGIIAWKTFSLRKKSSN